MSAPTDITNSQAAIPSFAHMRYNCDHVGLRVSADINHFKYRIKALNSPDEATEQYVYSCGHAEDTLLLELVKKAIDEKQL